jgi:hypothetical protein
MLEISQGYLRANITVDTCDQDSWLAVVYYLSFLCSLCSKTLVIILVLLLLLNIVLCFIIVLLPLFATLDDYLELQHHSNELGIFNRCEDPVETYEVLSILFICTLAYFKHVFSADLLYDQELIQFLIELFNVPLENSVALKLLFVSIVFKLEAVLISKFLQELLEIALLAKGF